MRVDKALPSLRENSLFSAFFWGGMGGSALLLPLMLLDIYVYKSGIFLLSLSAILNLPAIDSLCLEQIHLFCGHEILSTLSTTLKTR